MTEEEHTEIHNIIIKTSVRQNEIIHWKRKGVKEVYKNFL